MSSKAHGPAGRLGATVDQQIWAASEANRSERSMLRAIHSKPGLLLLRSFLNMTARSGVVTARITSIWVDKHPQVADPCCIRKKNGSAASSELADVAVLIRRIGPRQNDVVQRMWLLQAKRWKGASTFASASSAKQIGLFECTSGAPRALDVWSGSAISRAGTHLGTFDLGARFGTKHLPGKSRRDPYFWSYLLIDVVKPGPDISPLWHQWTASGPSARLSKFGFAEGIALMSDFTGTACKRFGADWMGPADEWERLGKALLTEALARASPLAAGRWVRSQTYKSFLSYTSTLEKSQDVSPRRAIGVASTGLVASRDVRKRWQRYDEKAVPLVRPEERVQPSAVSFIVIDQLQED